MFNEFVDEFLVSEKKLVAEIKGEIIVVVYCDAKVIHF